jgi:DnaK suppressor protein
MTHSRQSELKAMLEGRRAALEEQIHHKIRAFRDTDNVETTRPAIDLSDDPAQEDIDFALVQMQAQTLNNISSALSRLEAGDYGICRECDEEIPEARLRALPFATRCRTCQEEAEAAERRARVADRHTFGAGFGVGTVSGA